MTGPVTKWVFGGMSVTSLSVGTLEYVRVKVSATVGGLPVNPTADVVKMAFLATNVTPVVSDWKAATWDSPGSDQYFAQCLVGPAGTVTLTAGAYYLWVQVTDNPEIPARQIGVITMTV